MLILLLILIFSCEVVPVGVPSQVLSAELQNLRWQRCYERNVFDCSQMSSALSWYLENEGWDTKIVCGNCPFSDGYHAWLLVKTGGNYTPVEATSLRVIEKTEACYNNYFIYDHEFETMEDAVAVWASEFGLNGEDELITTKP